MAALSPDKSVPSLAALAKLGCSEVVVRVSQYATDPGSRGPDGSSRPVQWQAIAKHVNASLPWAVAVRGDPDEADRDARLCFVELNSKPNKVAALARQQAPKKPSPRPVVAADDTDLDDLI